MWLINSLRLKAYYIYCKSSLNIGRSVNSSRNDKFEVSQFFTRGRYSVSYQFPQDEPSCISIVQHVPRNPGISRIYHLYLWQFKNMATMWKWIGWFACYKQVSIFNLSWKLRFVLPIALIADCQKRAPYSKTGSWVHRKRQTTFGSESPRANWQ